MKITVLILALMTLMVACSQDTPTSTAPSLNLDQPLVAEGAVDVWVIDGETFTTEPEAWDAFAKRADGGTCWHWTHDEGQWYVRHCGLTLAEECFTRCGPYGAMCPCEDGPGGNW